MRLGVMEHNINTHNQSEPISMSYSCALEDFVLNSCSQRHDLKGDRFLWKEKSLAQMVQKYQHVKFTKMVTHGESYAEEARQEFKVKKEIVPEN